MSRKEGRARISSCFAYKMGWVFFVAFLLLTMKEREREREREMLISFSLMKS